MPKALEVLQIQRESTASYALSRATTELSMTAGLQVNSPSNVEVGTNGVWVENYPNEPEFVEFWTADMEVGSAPV